MQAQWYLVYTKPHWEQKVAFFIEAILHQEVYLPLWSPEGQVKESTPFFPHYLFVHLNLEDFPIYTLRQTPGVRSLPKFDNQLLPVPEDVIESVRAYIAQTRGQVYARGQLFHKGDRVAIIRGVLKGKHALFDRQLSGPERVRVLLTILGRLVPTEVSLNMLEKLTFVAQPPRPPRRTRGRGRRIKQRTRL